MPRPKENAPPPAQFNLQELQIGRRKWRSGTSGPMIKLMPDPMMGLAEPKPIQRYETCLCGKIMFGNKRFAFEVLEVDCSHEKVAEVLRKKKIRPRDEFEPTFFNLLLAKSHFPIYSFQVKFEDVVSLECQPLHGEWEAVVQLKKPLSCYMKTNGSSLVTVESPVGIAKTVRFITGPPMADKNHVAWRCDNQVPFHMVRQLSIETSPMLEALFTGRRVEKPAAPVKRKANKDTPANVAKRLKKDAQGSKALSDHETKLLDVEDAKKCLNEYVQNLAETVDADWHDSYEETGEMLAEWFSDCGGYVKKALRAATEIGAGFGHAHEILKCVHDTWLNINAIPFRGCPRDDLQECAVNLMSEDDEAYIDDEDNNEVQASHVGSIEDMLKITWPILLARAANDSGVSDETLKQMLKDAHDNGVTTPELPHATEKHLLSTQNKAVQKAVSQGRTRLSTVAASDWKSYPCTVKKHSMRRCIDRRFDGPKHLRTRCFSDSEDSDCGFGGLGGFGKLFGFGF